ncbi:hypothetical protein ACFP3U_17940 [Kitasatospora misakiensis]|uniref:Uncharacterized protein n=1 Tax=Kitasatospora misakiensis TaxID=67330 RepID=A0ABW0X6Q7_9ACTN
MNSPTVTAPPTGSSTRRARHTLRAERAALRCTGALLALAAAGAGGVPGGVVDRAGSAGVPVAAALAMFGAWAAVPSEESPRPAFTWPARLAARRTTVLATAAVLLAAPGDPGPWRAAGLVVLLTAHLLLVDAFGPHRRTPRPAHALAALAAALLVLPVALAATPAGEWSRPIALLGITAAAWGIGRALRPPRPGAEETGEPGV